ncbi:MAG: TolB-like protein/Flp pilus assembly protein TadD [Alteromonadaceae bacterium]|jgi:TolB-like protein/Flp pilus assembly protein TadD
MAEILEQPNNGFIDKLKQRQVFKVATIYAVAAWPLIQIADLAVPALGLPDSVMTLLLKIFITGFPISLIFAWLFNFTSKGIVRAKDDTKQGHTSQVNLQTTIAVAGTLVLAVIITLTSQLWREELIQDIPAKPVRVDINSIKKILAVKKESIAILPFVPFSNDPDDEFFADGMVEELLNVLAKIPDLQVAARTSSFAYKGVSNKTIAEIGKELGVATILEGSIRKNDVTNKIRVTAQLIKVSTGEHMWSETYDREYRDIFQIQDDIARAVVDKMKVTLLGSPTSTFIADTKNVDAMVALGKGQNELAHRTAPSITKALQHFKDAVVLDENYARAYVGIADASILLALYSDMDIKDIHATAETAIDKALSLNPNLGAAYASKGLLNSYTDPKIAEKYFKKAIELSPNYAMTYMWYASLLRETGSLIRAQALNEKAFELDPKSPVAAYNVASAYYDRGNEGKAMEIFSQIIANDPYYPGAYNLVGDILTHTGRLDESVNMYQRAIDIDPINKHAVTGLIKANIDMGNSDIVNQWFTYSNEKGALLSQKHMSYLKSQFYASLGERENSLNALKSIEFSDNKMGEKSLITAEIAYYQGKYSQAITAFEQIRTSPLVNEKYFYRLEDGRAALHLAYSYYQIERFDEGNDAINSFLKIVENDKLKENNSYEYYYTMAMIKSIEEKNDEAFYYLQGAIDAGWVRVWEAEIEPIYAHLSSQIQFTQMMGGVKARLATMRNRIEDEGDFLLSANN